MKALRSAPPNKPKQNIKNERHVITMIEITDIEISCGLTNDLNTRITNETGR